MYLWPNDLTRTSRRLESAPIVKNRDRQLGIIRTKHLWKRTMPTSVLSFRLYR